MMITTATAGMMASTNKILLLSSPAVTLTEGVRDADTTVVSTGTSDIVIAMLVDAGWDTSTVLLMAKTLVVAADRVLVLVIATWNRMSRLRFIYVLCAYKETYKYKDYASKAAHIIY